MGPFLAATRADTVGLAPHPGDPVGYTAAGTEQKVGCRGRPERGATGSAVVLDDLAAAEAVIQRLR